MDVLLSWVLLVRCPSYPLRRTPVHRLVVSVREGCWILVSKSERKGILGLLCLFRSRWGIHRQLAVPYNYGQYSKGCDLNVHERPWSMNVHGPRDVLRYDLLHGFFGVLTVSRRRVSWLKNLQNHPSSHQEFHAWGLMVVVVVDRWTFFTSKGSGWSLKVLGLEVLVSGR